MTMMSAKWVAAVAVGTLGLFAPEAQAGRCDKVEKYAAQLKVLADKVCEAKDGQWKSCDKLESQAAAVEWFAQWWNGMTSGTWAQLGPRNLNFASRDKGTLITPGQRIWVSSMPVGGDKASFTIKYEDGKAGMDVNYCVIDASGKTAMLDFEELPKGSKKSPAVKHFTKAQVGGRFLAVEMIARGPVTSKYEYNITLDGEPMAMSARPKLVGPVKPLSPTPRPAPTARTGQ